MKSADECNTEGLGQTTIEAGVPGSEEEKLNQSISHACEMMVGTRLIISAMFEDHARYQNHARARDFLIGWSYELLEIERHLRQAWQEYTAHKNQVNLLTGN